MPPGCEDGQVLKVPVDEKIMARAPFQEPYFYVYVTVEKSPYFRREAFDIFSEHDVSLCQSILGGTIFVKGLHKETLAVKIPPLSGSHETIVACEEGIPRSDGLPRGTERVTMVSTFTLKDMSGSNFLGVILLSFIGATHFHSHC